MKQFYDWVGPCLGTGGMGGVWAARVGDGAGENPGNAGTWVAVKAIPVELQPGGRDAGGLHSGLRECLSTFSDLSSVHVVRYEKYWFEEPEHLPGEIREFCKRGFSSASRAAAVVPGGRCGRPSPQASSNRAMPSGDDDCREGLAASGEHAAESDDVDADGDTLADVQSRRFCESTAGGGAGAAAFGGDAFGGAFSGACDFELGIRISRTFSGSLMSPLGESCGFVWEEASEPSVAPAASSSSAAAAAPMPQLEDRPRDHRPEGHGSSAFVAGAAQWQPPQCVVVLIEMELMGQPPDGGPTVATEARLTLRAWLQQGRRTFSDAADVFGSLMLSVRHIHRKRIVHADLKPDNIFCVVERNRVTAVRIGDFGLAGENQLFRQFSYGVLRRPTNLGGTPGYVAPEIMSAERGAGACEVCPCSDKVDIYACAVILLELLLVPFRTHMERAKALELCCTQKVLPDFISSRLPKTRALIQEMCEREPMMRLSAEEVCKRFEKEVRKELCRSGTQLCCSPNFSGRPSGACRAQSEPAVQKGCATPMASPPVQGDSGKHRKHGRKGRRRM